MIRLLFILCVAAAAAAGAAWVANHPGFVTIRWAEWRVDTSVAFLLAAMAAISLALLCFYLFVRALILAPVRFSQRLKLWHYQKGMTELTYSVASLAAADLKNAQFHTRKAEKLLGQTPLTLLLSAQVARSEGDDEKTRLLLTRMLDYKETEYLAARSLSDSATKQQLFAKALPLAERANAINPREKSSAVTLIGLHIRMSRWHDAIHAASKAARKGALLRSERRYYHGIAYLKHAMGLLDNSQPDVAVPAGYRALKHLPRFVPAVIFTARALASANRPDKAIRLILKHWKSTPHPELAETMRVAMAKYPKEKQMKLAKKLAASLPDHVESLLALAETAIKFKEWETARGALKAVLAKEESTRACKLMAYVEQGEFSDYDAAGRWLARSAEALPDPAWMCGHCAKASHRWDSHCHACGDFDTLEWKQPALRFAAA